MVDFDPETQAAFDKIIEVSPSDIKQYLNKLGQISSPQDYRDELQPLVEQIIEEAKSWPYLYKNLDGVESIEDLAKLKTISTADLMNALLHCRKNEPDRYFKAISEGKDSVVYLHSSGTTGKASEGLKMIAYPTDVMNSMWGRDCGCMWINSGLEENSTAVFFNAPRSRLDGLSKGNGYTIMTMYTSEMANRVGLSIVKPKKYHMFTFSEPTTLRVLLECLSLETINVLSAIPSVILQWATLPVLKGSLTRQFSSEEGKHQLKQRQEQIAEIFGRSITDVNVLADEIYRGLKDRVRDSTLVFGAGSVTPLQWKLLRSFFGWEEGKERITNIYGGTEIGVVGGGFCKDDQGYIAHSGMGVIPNRAVLISSNNEKVPIWTSKRIRGRPLVTRMGFPPAINLDVGDIVQVTSAACKYNLPTISDIVQRDHAQYGSKVNLPGLADKKEIWVSENIRLIDTPFPNQERLFEYLINIRRLIADGYIKLDVTEEEGLEKAHLTLYAEPTSDDRNKDQLRNSIIDSLKERDDFHSLYVVAAQVQSVKFDLELLPPGTIQRYYWLLYSEVNKGNRPIGHLKRWRVFITDPKML